MAKHLSYDDRLTIEKLIKFDFSIAKIASELGRHKSTISREIRLRAIISKKGCYGRGYNACVHRFDCDIKGICEKSLCKKPSSYCRFCKHCNDHCKYFEEEVCTKLNLSPYVCNNCEKKNKCTLTKLIYSAKDAQKDYENLLIESRSGIETSPEEIQRIDNIVTPLIKQGQSIHHIHANNKDTIMVSEKTLYTYIDDGLLSVKNIDLPRKVKYKPRKTKQMGYKVDKKCLEGRRYDDYIEFLKENVDISIVQMDTVEGKKGGKVMLTIHFVDTAFMLMLIRDANDSKSVTQWFETIYESIEDEHFKTLFPVLLTDYTEENTMPKFFFMLCS